LRHVKAATKAHIAVLCTNLFFACNFSFVKAISPHLVKPFALNIFRVGFSLILFWIVFLFAKSSARIERKDWGRFALCGLTGVAINQMLFIKGLVLTSTIHASLLMLVTPLLITVFALWVLKEQVTIFKIAGLVLGIAGSVLLITSKENSQHATNYVLGDILILINAISYSCYFILVKPLMHRYNPLHVIRWVFTFGFIIMLPFGWDEMMQVQFSTFQPQHFLFLFLIVFTGTFLAYYFNAFGIQHLGAGITGMYIYTQPVFAVLIATLILHEALGWQKLLAACFIFSGVYLVSFRKKLA
jgi:drug/metabolite transporter (DMT)-like permease